MPLTLIVFVLLPLGITLLSNFADELHADVRVLLPLGITLLSNSKLCRMK